MKYWKVVLIAAAAVLLLSGCASWMDGSYASVERHTEQGFRAEEGMKTVSDYQEICASLADMVENAIERRTVSVTGIPADILENNLNMAIRKVMNTNPLAAYAVESITYQTGTSGGMSAVVFTIQYNHNRAEIQGIKTVRGMDETERRIRSALDQVADGIVLRVTDYQDVDYTQIVQDYAQERPDKVMEIPQITANVYPESGSERVIALTFTYQTSRESLKNMQTYVQPMFSSAALYVSTEDQESVKFVRLYAFLMETMTYTQETSITPAYSLLRHGVGDSKALATVYAAMCRRAGLECLVVSGTRAGEPWFWNMISEDGVHYHVDLSRSYGAGAYQKLTDEEMSGYVWDYAAYPACGVADNPADQAEPNG